MGKGGLAIGLGVRAVKSVDIGLFAHTAGFDWLFIDCEHGALDLGTVSEIATAALGQGVTPIVRVPGKEHHHASRVLDNGAQGVVVPHIENADEARQVVSNCRVPPIGHRSISRSSALFGFRDIPIPEFVEAVNAATLVCVMLESPNAIANAEACSSKPLRASSSMVRKAETTSASKRGFEYPPRLTPPSPFAGSRVASSIRRL